MMIWEKNINIIHQRNVDLNNYKILTYEVDFVKDPFLECLLINITEPIVNNKDIDNHPNTSTKACKNCFPLCMYITSLCDIYWLVGIIVNVLCFH